MTSALLRYCHCMLLMMCLLPWSAFAGTDLVARTPQFSSAFVTAPDGARIHYLQGGTANAQPAVVFIPGWTWSASIWEPQMTRLVSDHRVIAMDPRSQGDSAKTTERNTPEGRAEDIAALLQNLGEAPVVLVGWSQGVQDAAAYVEQFGTDRLAGIVLVDSALAAGPAGIDVDRDGSKQLLDRMGIYVRYPSEYLAGMMDASRTHPFTADEKAQLVAQARKTPTSTGLSMLVSDVLTRDRRGVVAKIDKPTLVIASATSGELAAQKQMALDIPQATLQVVEDAGHAVFLDQPEEFSRALAWFLDKLAGKSPDPS